MTATHDTQRRGRTYIIDQQALVALSEAGTKLARFDTATKPVTEAEKERWIREARENVEEALGCVTDSPVEVAPVQSEGERDELLHELRLVVEKAARRECETALALGAATDCTYELAFDDFCLPCRARAALLAAKSPPPTTQEARTDG